MLRTVYQNSYALIVGIDCYLDAPPLSYAVNDANGVAEVLRSAFKFPDDNITLLLNDGATAANIRRAFMRFTSEDFNTDDRLIFFFAGHGRTRCGRHGDVGFLVPHDGHDGDYSTFLRWNELTDHSDLIRPKHLLYIMDACYGGLALKRKSERGSTRFLRDIMTRYSRQVITAGKADQVVADGGGPLPGHSIFTGHLLEGLQGKAKNGDGLLTAATLMPYVYQQVGSDAKSIQTPQFGQLDGDGDFVFSAPTLDDSPAESEIQVLVPQIVDIDEPLARSDKISLTKQLIGDGSSAITLHDFVMAEIRWLLSETSDDSFIVTGSYSDAEFLTRLSRYEAATLDIAAIAACIAHWGKQDHILVLEKLLARASDRLESEAGLVAWVQLRWYPLILLIYAAGIAAVSARRFDILDKVLRIERPDPYGDRLVRLVVQAARSMNELAGMRLWQKLPGYERHHTPLSDYLLKLLQPVLEDALFLGRDYEHCFEEFEVHLALTISDFERRGSDIGWGPWGRFTWKDHNNPLERLIRQEAQVGASWGPLKAGLYDADGARFRALAQEWRGRRKSW